MASKLATRAANMRNRFAMRERDLVGSSVGVATGLVTGALEKNGALPISVLGLPSKLGLGILGLTAAAFVGGKFGHVVRRTSDAMLTCYAYNAGKTGAVIAGYDDFVGADDDDDPETVVQG